MKLWSWVVACSLGSSMALTWLGMDGELARTARRPSAARAAPNGTPNAIAGGRPVLITSQETGKQTSHHQGNI